MDRFIQADFGAICFLLKVCDIQFLNFPQRKYILLRRLIIIFINMVLKGLVLIFKPVIHTVRNETLILQKEFLARSTLVVVNHILLCFQSLVESLL